MVVIMVAEAKPPVPAKLMARFMAEEAKEPEHKKSLGRLTKRSPGKR